jgi:hypothetical protein
MIPSILMMETIRSSEPLVLTRATLHHITEDGILQEAYLFVLGLTGLPYLYVDTTIPKILHPLFKYYDLK